MFRKFGLFLVVATSLGCQVMPTDYTDYNEGQWSSKVLVKDKTKSKSFIVNVDLQAIKNKNLRMDVTAALGTPVAAFVLNGDSVEYLLFRQKRFYSGKANSNALKPILSVPLNPQLLYNILFDMSFETKDWSCSKDANGFLGECRNDRQNLKVIWKDRKGRRKAVYIEHPKADIQMNITDFEPKVDAVFSLKVPDSFKKYRIR